MYFNFADASYNKIKTYVVFVQHTHFSNAIRQNIHFYEFFSELLKLAAKVGFSKSLTLTKVNFKVTFNFS